MSANINDLATKRNIDIKVLLIGDSQVGKTTLLLSYFQGVFTVNLESHYRGINLFRKSTSLDLSTHDTINYFINVWDVAGSENYIDFFSLITQPMDAIIILSNDKKRFNLEITVKKWTDIINKYVSSNFLKYLIVNDSDLQEFDKELKERFQNEYKISKQFMLDIQKISQVDDTLDEIFSEIISLKHVSTFFQHSAMVNSES